MSWQPKSKKKTKSGVQTKMFVQMLESFNMPKPIPEFMFAKDINRKWRIDYYFEHNGKKVALEVEGGVWTGGRHTRGSGFSKDMEKYNELAKHGIFLIRVVPSDLLSIATMDLIKGVIYQ